jgi:VIT1/CCC1 family predicted Fe2+/Mn2+ transporter
MSEYESLFAGPDVDEEPFVEYRWLNGALWGLSLGIGVALYAVVFRLIELQFTTMLLIVLAGVLVGLAWSRFGPIKD